MGEERNSSCLGQRRCPNEEGSGQFNSASLVQDRDQDSGEELAHLEAANNGALPCLRSVDTGQFSGRDAVERMTLLKQTVFLSLLPVLSSRFL